MNQYPPGFPPNGQQPQYPQQQAYGQPQQQVYAPQPAYGQPPQQASIFAGMRTATIFKAGNYYTPGIYNVEIIRCKTLQTRKGPLGFVVELKTLASNNPAEQVGGPDKSWYQDMTTYPQIAQSEILQFLLAIYKIDQNDVPAVEQLKQNSVAILDAAVSDQNILAGQCLRLVVHMKKTKGKGGDFSVHTWSPYDGTEPPPMAAGAPTFSPTPAQAAPQTFYQQPGLPPGMPPPMPTGAVMPPGMMQQQPQQQFTPPPGFTQTPAMPLQQFGAPLPQAAPAYGYAPPQAGAPPQVAAPQGPGPQPTPVFNPATRQWELPR